jgi:hypothetical protein
MLVIAPVSLLGQSGRAPAAGAQTGQGQPGQAQTGQNQTEQAQSGQAQTGQDQSALGQVPAAILHTQGGVWVNGYEARDSSAIFVGDLLETKPGFSANLSLEGTAILIQPESVGKLQDGLLVLDHGGVSVGTSKSFKVRVNCITVVPVLNEWTQYDVTDVNGTVQVAARKNDVKVEVGNGQKAPKPPETSNDATVREGEQRNYRESEACGAPAQPEGVHSGLNPKWIIAGAAGGGVLIWILVHGGGGKTPVSASQP